MVPSPHSLVIRVLSVLFMLSSSVRSMTTSSSTNSMRVVVHWFRLGDLRLHDNPALVRSSSLVATGGSSSNNAVVIPIFCFDSKLFGPQAPLTPSGSLKCGPKRAKFILESVSDLRRQLQSRLGSQLLVAHGEPAQIFDKLLSQLKCQDVSIVCQDEVVKEEKDSVKEVASVLHRLCPKKGNRLYEIWGSTMYDRQDLPFETETLRDMPDGFTPFRTKVEQKSKIASPLPVPSKLPFPASSDSSKLVNDMATYMPTLQDLGYTEEQIMIAETVDPRGVMNFRGGETAALARVQEYIWDKDLLKNYFDTRNGMIGGDYSTKFSPWLAHGCLSPRHVVAECKRYEHERVANKSTYWVVFELLWRDFCKFFAVKHGNAIFVAGGTIGSDKTWSHWEANFEAWKAGRTGYPLVDANMREMKATGFMSNRGRQNVASFLAIDLAHDWRCGGDWFESQLIDYDVYSNWVVSVSELDLLLVFLYFSPSC